MKFSTSFVFNVCIFPSMIFAAQGALKQPLLGAVRAIPCAEPVSGSFDASLPVAKAILQDQRSTGFQFISAACENDYAKACVLMSQGGFDPRKLQVSISGNLGEVLLYLQKIDPRIIAFTGNNQTKNVHIMSRDIAETVKAVKPLLGKAEFKIVHNNPVLKYKDGVRVQPQ